MKRVHVPTQGITQETEEMLASHLHGKREIVREAGVAKGTFSVHFATKDAVITDLVRNQVRIARRARETSSLLEARRSKPFARPS